MLASYTVIGVAPKAFTGSFYGFNGDLLLSLAQMDQGTPQWRTQRDARLLFLIARLRAGVTQRQAQAELTTLSSQLATAYPKEEKGQAAVITRPSLLGPGGLQDAELLGAVLMAGVLLVLLIACANVANLLLAVAVGRRLEAATKMALGASRGRLIREFLTESAIICAVSSALGYLMAAGVIARFSDFTVVLPMFGTYSFAIDLRLDAAVIGCAAALTLLAIVATGLAPARYASSLALAQVLSGELVVGGTRKGTRRNALVIIQVAVCTLALVGMGLCQRSLYNLRHVDPGFSARNLVAAMVVVRGQGETVAQVGERFATLRREVSALPGVDSVSLSSDLPLLADHTEGVRVRGRDQPVTSVGDMTVDGEYFATFGVRVRAGRVFVASDGQNGLDAVVINRTLAEKLWPGQDAVGQPVAVEAKTRLRQAFQRDLAVVEDGKYGDLDESARPFLYHALRPDHDDDTIIVVARTRGNPDLWLAPLAKAVRDLHLTLLWSPVTFDGWMNFTLLADRVTAGWAAGLSALGVLLVIVGLFGAISCAVSERKRELAISWPPPLMRAAAPTARDGAAPHGPDHRHWNGDRARARSGRDHPASFGVLRDRCRRVERAHSSQCRHAGDRARRRVLLRQTLDHHRSLGSRASRLTRSQALVIVKHNVQTIISGAR